MGTVSIYSNPPGGNERRAHNYRMKARQFEERKATEARGEKWIPGPPSQYMDPPGYKDKLKGKENNANAENTENAAEAVEAVAVKDVCSSHSPQPTDLLLS